MSALVPVADAVGAVTASALTLKDTLCASVRAVLPLAAGVCSLVWAWRLGVRFIVGGLPGGGGVGAYGGDEWGDIDTDDRIREFESRGLGIEFCEDGSAWSVERDG